MNKADILRQNLKLLYKKIKNKNLNKNEKLIFFIKLQIISDKYIRELAEDEKIQWQDFYSIVDVLNDNLYFLKKQFHE